METETKNVVILLLLLLLTIITMTAIASTPILASIMGLDTFDTYERHQPLTRHEQTNDY